MEAQVVIAILATLDESGVQVWVDGGWGIDALLGEQTRQHGDLDLIVASCDVPRLRKALAVEGYHAEPGGTPANFVLVHPSRGSVDVHVIEFDDRGYGSFVLSDGRKWPFPPL